METAIFTEKLVPQVYKESRDFQVFLKLLDITVTTVKYEIDNWIKLYDPNECPDNFLPLLGEMVGYEYNKKLSMKETRIIIANFVQLLRNRGSKIGLQQAISILLNAKLASDPDNEAYKLAVNQLEFLEIYFDTDTSMINMYFPQAIEYNTDLLDYVRPVGSFITIEQAEFPAPESDIAISAKANYRQDKFKPTTGDKSYKVGKAEVNLSQIAINGEKINPVTKENEDEEDNENE